MGRYDGLFAFMADPRYWDRGKPADLAGAFMRGQDIAAQRQQNQARKMQMDELQRKARTQAKISEILATESDPRAQSQRILKETGDMEAAQQVMANQRKSQLENLDVAIDRQKVLSQGAAGVMTLDSKSRATQAGKMFDRWSEMGIIDEKTHKDFMASTRDSTELTKLLTMMKGYGQVDSVSTATTQLGKLFKEQEQFKEGTKEYEAYTQKIQREIAGDPSVNKILAGIYGKVLRKQRLSEQELSVIQLSAADKDPITLLLMKELKKRGTFDELADVIGGTPEDRVQNKIKSVQGKIDTSKASSAAVDPKTGTKYYYINGKWVNEAGDEWQN